MNEFISAEGVLGISFLVCCVITVLIRTSRTAEFQAIDMSTLAAGLIYGITFPLVVFGAATVNFPGVRYIYDSSEYSFIHTFAALLAIIGIHAGWRVVPRSILRISSNIYTNTSPRSIVVYLYAMLAISVSAMYLYTMDYGGLFGYFDYNLLIRSGIFTFDRSSYSFLQPLGNFVLLSCFGFFGLILSRRISALVVIGFLMSLVFSAYVLSASAGRVAILIFIAVFPISIMLALRLRPIAWILSIFAFSVSGLALLFLLSNFLELKGANDLFQYTVREVSFVFVSFFAELNEGQHFNLFRDVLMSPVHLLPSSITAQWHVPADQQNTALIMGNMKGVGGVTGTIPTDLLTFGLMQAHVVGVFLFAALFGAMLRVVTSIANSLPLRGLVLVFTAYIFAKVAIVSMFYASPNQFILSHFPIIVVLLATFAWRFLRVRVFGRVKVADGQV